MNKQPVTLARMLLPPPHYDPNDNEAGMKLLEDLTTNAYQIQLQVLKEILTRNAKTEYLKGYFNLNIGHFDVDVLQVFKKNVPVVNYEDIKPYIERIANGEPSDIISAQPITEFLTSSGTSGGQPKMMPSTDEDLERKTFFYNMLIPVMNKTKYIEVIVTGSMAQYIPILEFYSGGLPLVSTMYASSECYFGINFKPLCKPSDVSYTLLPNMAYFEFLPVEKSNGELTQEFQCNGISDQDCQHDETEIVDLTNVKLGHCYELVVTTFTGLYRYRVGDILMVTGFHNNAPQFWFVHRKNVILSIDTDKTNEEDLLKAVTEAKLLIEPLGFLLTEYTAYADTCSIPGHYVVFWELKSKGSNNLSELDTDIMEQCCSRVEESLDSVYRRCRKKDNSIGPLEIRVVKDGTFDALMDFSVSQGSSVNQYKTPRCIKSEEAINLLDSKVVGRFFSKRVPSWEPFGITVNK
ncbi:Indole-3-acetic acid-amido synthetase GH3.17 [Citrus sinensis]|uniref:Indole-3-acetic acid-amido synthetase GH3.17 n=1 Tax=Citrus sinensis TaxID=2711 RepID=A0ACB8KDE8_CITSI|nr:Indole-3-acetic acid-amido synthetase GH3.17 [Citrus sinensis]